MMDTLRAVRGARELPGSFGKVAIFGGIYSNYLALENAINLAHGLSAEAIFCLGDLGGFGPFPDRASALLRDAGIHVMRGNYDESIARDLGDCGCGYSDPRDNHFAQLSYDYTAARTSIDTKNWMRDLPAAFRFRLGNTSVLGCHGSPRQINEFLWETGTPDGLLRRFLDASEADLILGTHSGIKWERRLPDGRGFVNVGVLGRPENDGSPRVWFTMLEADATGGYRAAFVPVFYDHERLAHEMRSEGLPEEFATTILTGWWTSCLENLPAKERSRGPF
jgi:diadenosine tetraphosphatase ApaH/serine/threonine PP2A family protein phosphatase